MSYETLIVEKDGPVLTITLNRPQRLNSINRQMLVELGKVADELVEDNSARVVIITGGDKCFCAGADISELGYMSTPREAEVFHNLFKTTLTKVESLNRPVIAAISGVAMGGGLELALVCDLRIATDTARMGVPEIKIGAIPGAGATQRLPRLIGAAKAKEMVYIGDPMDANEGLRLGLVSKVVPVEALMSEARQLAATLASRPRLALKAAKLSINSGLDMDLHRALDFEIQCQMFLFSTKDREEGMKAFLEKRKPNFIGE
ncbi:MAG: enoyl-CoA hydratase/isomerase family protein [Chloroflexi bacterium]|nr:enoyl-CoA hydratase/isomerase family protein [Chloroflexota bacterium]